MFRRIDPVLLVVAVLLLAGCTATASPHLSTTARPAPSATASAAPSTAASAAAEPPATCENIVSPAAYTELTTAPNEFVPEFTSRMRAPGSQLYRFIELGGIACQWGHPNSDVVFDLATSPITDAQAAVEKATLLRLGWTSSVSEGAEIFTRTGVDDLYLPVYSFSPGRWKYALLEADLKLFA